MNAKLHTFEWYTYTYVHIDKIHNFETKLLIMYTQYTTIRTYACTYMHCYHNYVRIHTMGKWSNSIMSPLLDLRNDFTSPWCMNGIIMCSVSSSVFMLTPMRLNTLGWSSLLVRAHSSMKFSTLDDEISTYVHTQKHNRDSR